MRLFKILFKKFFRDIFRNWKQFISILFIVGIASTLFIGLIGNSKSFSNRVTSVYERGNIADEWVTITSDISDLESQEKILRDIQILSGNNGEIEPRLYVPSTISLSDTVAIIQDTFPKINTAIDLESDGFDDNDFFVIDKKLVNKYQLSTGKEIQLGDKIDVSFQAVIFSTLINDFLNDEDKIADAIRFVINNLDINDTTKTFLKSFADTNGTFISYFASNYLLDSFDLGENVVLSIPVSGFMSHPENMENGEFSTNSFLLSSRLLINTALSTISSNFSSEKLINALNDYKATLDNELVINVINSVIEYIQKDNNDVKIDILISLLNSNISEKVNDRNNAETNRAIRNLYNQVVVKLDPSVSSELFEIQVRTYFRLSETANLIAVLNRSSYPTVAVVENDIVQSRQLAYCFPIIFFVVAILIVLTTISQLVLNERTNIGTLKALGLSKPKIYLYYISMMDFVGFIGLLLGSIIGPVLITLILNIKYTILYSLPSVSIVFPRVTILIMALIVLALISSLTYILIRKDINISASESMRPLAPRINLKPRRVNKFKSLSIKIALRNMRVHLTKSIMVVIGVMGCCGLLICGMGIDDTLDYGVQTEVNNFYYSDILAQLNVGTKSGEALEELLTLEEVEKAEEFYGSTGTATASNRQSQMNLYAISAYSDFFKYDYNLPNHHRNIDEVGLSQNRAEDLGVHVGDTVLMDINGVNHEFKVGYIFYAFTLSGMVIYLEAYEDLFPTRTSAWIDIKDQYDHNLVNDKIAENCRTVASCATFESNIERIQSYMANIKTMTNTIKVFAILLAVVVLINLGILNFNERLREIATMKVLGFSRSEISRSLVFEALTLVLGGSILGTALGLPLEIMVLETNKVFIVSWTYVINWPTYLIALAITLVTALLVQIFISFRINKISMSESLKSVE